MKTSLVILTLFTSINAFSQFQTLKFISFEEEQEVNSQIDEEIIEDEKVDSISTESYFGNYTDKLLHYLLIENLKESNKIIKEYQSEKKQKKETKQKPVKNYPAFSYPLNNNIITSDYGKRFHPIKNKIRFHSGVDFRANYEPVYSILPGVVTVASNDNSGGGLYIKIQHNEGYESLYLHLSKFLKNVGDFVYPGELIAISGNSGNTTGPHLHFTVKKNGNTIDPIQFLNELNYYTQKINLVNNN